MNIAYAMGQSGGGGQGSSLMTFLPIIIILLVLFWISRKFLKGFKKGYSDLETPSGKNTSLPLGPTCKNCNVFYTHGEKFCRKCGEPLT